MSFSVRVGHQWAVNGDLSGFFHHVIEDPMSGACRDSCDPLKERLNGRVMEAPAGQASIPDRDKAAPKASDRYAFINPMFRFAVINGTTPPERDQQFRFATQGSFTPLIINVGLDVNMLIQPVGIAVVPTVTKEVAVTDGSINGLTVVSLSSLAAVRQFF
jgi:hypothetical protein